MLRIKRVVTRVLTLIVVLEIVWAFLGIFEHHRLGMIFLLEGLIFFTICEFMVLNFQRKLEGLDVL